MKSTQRSIFSKIYLVFLIVLPLPFFILPANYFDTGESLCLSKLLLHQECYGCGITRAIQHAIHFDFISAWRFNKLVALVLPILLFLWINEIKKHFFKKD
jgi:hypothetical protein